MCDHEQRAEHQGDVVCTACGLVLQSRTFAAPDWAPRAAQSSSYWAWRRAVHTVLRRLRISLDVAESFARPWDDAQLAEARRAASGLRLEVLGAYAVLLRFSDCVASEDARAAGGATPREWRAAALVFGAAAAPDQEQLQLYRLARQHRLPEAIPRAALRAMEEPRLECCDPQKVLVASASESLGDEATADIFQLPPEAVCALRCKYRVPCAADLTVPGLMLKLCVARCQREGAERAREAAELRGRGEAQAWWHGTHGTGARAQPEAPLQEHLVSCSSCAFRAQEIGLGFLAP